MAVDFTARVRPVAGAEPTAWAWDFDCDGTADSVEPDGVTRVFETAGVHYPRLSVTDEQGNTGQAIARVEVEPVIGLSLSDDAFDPRSLRGRSRRAPTMRDNTSYERELRPVHP